MKVGKLEFLFLLPLLIASFLDEMNPRGGKFICEETMESW